MSSCEEEIWPSFVFCRFSIIPSYTWENVICRDNMLKLGERIESRMSPLPLLPHRLAGFLILRLSPTLPNICFLVPLGRQEELVKVVWTDSVSGNINRN